MRREKGFTLIELVMVIVILGILSAVAIPRYVNMQDEATSATAKGVIGSMRSAIAIQYAKNALAGTAAFPTMAELTATGSASIFAEGQVPDSPVIDSANIGAAAHNSVIAGSSPIVVGDVDGTSAYLYDESQGEIRFNNAAVDPITGKAWWNF